MHVSQLELGVLELGDAPAELDALLGVLDGLLDGSLGQTQGLGGNTDTAAVQGLHGDTEALALLAQQAVLGDNAVLHNQLTGGGALDAHLLLVLAHGEAGVGALHDEGGDLLLLAAALVGGNAGDGKDHEHVGVAGVGDEDLGAVEDPVLPLLVQHGGGLLALGIGAGARLGQAERADPLAGAQLGQVILLLLLGAVLIDGSAAQGGVGGDDNAGGAADLAHLLDGHDIGQNVRAGAAVLLGEIDAHHPQLRHLLDGFLGERLVLVHPLGQGLDFIFGEVTVHLAEHFLLSGKVQIHLLPSS